MVAAGIGDSPMMNKPQNDTSRDSPVPESGPAVGSVRTAQEAETAATKRDAEAKLEDSPPLPAGDSRKRHGDKLARAVEQAADEPVPDDEP
jgi:hypothetical protein